MAILKISNLFNLSSLISNLFKDGNTTKYVKTYATT